MLSRNCKKETKVRTNFSCRYFDKIIIFFCWSGHDKSSKKLATWTSSCYKSCKIILFQFHCYQSIHIFKKRSLPQDHGPNKPEILQYGVFANSLVMEMNDAFQQFYNTCVIFTYPRVSHADKKWIQAQHIKSQPAKITKS